MLGNWPQCNCKKQLYFEIIPGKCFSLAYMMLLLGLVKGLQDFNYRILGLKNLSSKEVKFEIPDFILYMARFPTSYKYCQVAAAAVVVIVVMYYIYNQPSPNNSMQLPHGQQLQFPPPSLPLNTAFFNCVCSQFWFLSYCIKLFQLYIVEAQNKTVSIVLASLFNSHRKAEYDNQYAQ